MADDGTGVLAGRTAIVTGSGHGIGRAYAHRLAAAGAAVVVAELDQASGQVVAEEIRAAGGDALAVPTDVADEDSVAAMVEAATDRFESLDILVNNAAIFATIPISRAGVLDIPVDEWDLVMRVNLRGTWLPTRAVIPVMAAKGYGKIINVSSDTAFKATAGRSHYVASKAGVAGFTRTVAREVGKDGIRVNCIAPGKTLSVDDPDDQSRAAHETVAQTQALPGVLGPEAMTGAVLFFASPDSDAITGQTLLVNGGAAMH
jgi:3-oxoacyl-[acyl-carrier protein] reductase